MKKKVLFIFSIMANMTIFGMKLDYDPQEVLFKICQGELTSQMGIAGLNEPDVVECLISQRADVSAKNKYGDAPLHLAGQAGRYRVMKKLLEHKADVWAAENTFQDTPLHAIIRCTRKSRHVACISFLLDHDKTLINAPNGLGETPLHVAAVYGSDEDIKSLVGKGADISLKNSKGDTPVDCANYYGKEERAQRMIDWYKSHTASKQDKASESEKERNPQG